MGIYPNIAQDDNVVEVWLRLYYAGCKDVNRTLSLRLVSV